MDDLSPDPASHHTGSVSGPGWARGLKLPLLSDRENVSIGLHAVASCCLGA